MRQMSIAFLLIVFLFGSLVINAQSIRKGIANETLLTGEFFAQPGSPVCNLKDKILSINVVSNGTVIHSYLIPILNSSFPIQYSIQIDERRISPKPNTKFQIIAVILEPIYVHDSFVTIPPVTVNSLNLAMKIINFVVIRGEILHDKYDLDHAHNLTGNHVKLELIEVGKEGLIVDQVDFICTTKKFPCPYEYWFDSTRVKANATYQLEATLSAARLLSRRTIRDKHVKHLAATKNNTSKPIKIKPMTDEVIEKYNIILIDTATIHKG